MSNAKKDHVTVPLRHYDGVIRQFMKALQLAKDKNVPSEVLESLEDVGKLVTLKDEFVEGMTTKISPGCDRLLVEATAHNWKKIFEDGESSEELSDVMLSGCVEGQFLKSFISVQRAKKAMEVGMFTAFGALSMAEALPADGEVVTIDNSPFLEPVIRPLLDKYPHGKKVKIMIGDASQVMRELAKKGEKFDVVFLDAEKAMYGDYLKICFRENLLAPNGTVLVDNAFQHADAFDPTLGETDAKSFATYLATQNDLHKVLIPMRDGVYMIRRLSEVEGVDAQ